MTAAVVLDLYDLAVQVHRAALLADPVAGGLPHLAGTEARDTGTRRSGS